MGLKGRGSSGGWCSFNGDACGCSGSGEIEAGVESPSSPSVVGVLGSACASDSGSNSLIWSVSGDGAALFRPVDNPDSSVSSLNLTGGSFDSSSGDCQTLGLKCPCVYLPTITL